MLFIFSYHTESPVGVGLIYLLCSHLSEECLFFTCSLHCIPKVCGTYFVSYWNSKNHPPESPVQKTYLKLKNSLTINPQICDPLQTYAKAQALF